MTSRSRHTNERTTMLASSAMDLVVTQVVDGTKGIHAFMPKAIFKKYRSRVACSQSLHTEYLSYEPWLGADGVVENSRSYF